ncbi:hypothetical protein [Fructobacillus parabroussonetiae]|uniref:hypothetical protein n=1 Tax=Fructobacillus parabroussonetiae TaxID=2713174 RepID=UPI001BD400F5|nr:hypothetical protein [Fructobacillus parabroussonetiae]
MVKKTDQRFLKADQAIRQTFLALLEKENFDKISSNGLSIVPGLIAPPFMRITSKNLI